VLIPRVGGVFLLSGQISVCFGNGSYPSRVLLPRIDSNLVDSASSIRLSQRLSHACLSISKLYVKLRMAHYISYSLFDGPCYLDNRSNSRANTCINP